MDKIEPKIQDIYNYDYYPYGQKFIVVSADDEWPNIYDQGYQITFIKESSGEKPILYLNRGVRVDLSKFEMSSENRRIMRKTEYLDAEIKELSAFQYDPIQVGKQSLDWFKARFPEINMHISRIKRIFTGGLNTHVFVYKDREKENRVIGYATALVKDDILHYTYPFYDQDYFKMNLGIGMMLRAVKWAKENNIKYIYLGTCNSQAALYKMQFKGVEWFDGQVWSDDISKLKSIIRNKSNEK